MADFAPLESGKQKSFWKRPEGVTGLIFLTAILAGLGLVGYSILMNFGTIMSIVASVLIVGSLLYMAIDPKMRNLVWYLYKNTMRKITGFFITIDPIGILKNYIDDLESNLKKMSKQIGAIRGQMRKLKTMVETNQREIDENMKIASVAKKQSNQKALTLATRKASRLRDSNTKYENLYNKMKVIHRILAKMYSNSEILLEDTRDQVMIKEQERKAIRASHSAMKSAMSVISGDPDKRAMFDAAMEVVADDVANKVGEMERFMDMSSGFMENMDIQNGIFEEKGIKMLEEWEKKSTLMLMGDEGGSLDLESPRAEPEMRQSSDDDNSYEGLFD